MTAPDHPTRQSILFAQTQAACYETGLHLPDFAERVARRYNANVAPEHRNLHLPAEPEGDSADAYFHWKDALRRRIERYLNGAVNLPVELEKAWLEALPSPYRERAIFHLFYDLGMLPVRLPNPDECTAQNLSRVLTEHAEALSASAPIVENGRIDEADRPHAANSYKEHLEAAAAHLNWAMRLQHHFPEETGQPNGPQVVGFPGHDKSEKAG